MAYIGFVDACPHGFVLTCPRLLLQSGLPRAAATYFRLKRISRLSGFPASRLVRYSNAWATGNNIYTNAFPIEFNQF